MAKKRVLIIGGGFGGIKAALELSDHEEFSVRLVSDRPTFEYHPALYRTATGGSHVISSINLNELLSNQHIDLVIDQAVKLDRHEKIIFTSGGKELKYDVLIIAIGVVTNYFGVKGLQEFSYGIKSLKEAEELKAHLHEEMIDMKRPDLNYIIVGGGPTGVELAGALPSYLTAIMKQHGIKHRAVHVDLVEASPRLVPRMPKSVSKGIKRRLRRLGIKVYLGKPVQAETAEHLMVGGKAIKSHTVIWTAGTANSPFFKDNNFLLSSNGRVQVDKLLQAWPGVFVIGDNADTKFSGMAQTALYDAIFVANNLKRHASGKKPLAYKAKRPIYIMPAGSHWAAVVWGKFQIYGWLGWLLRRAADWIGYKDLMPWWKATERMMADDDTENSCALCASKEELA